MELTFKRDKDFNNAYSVICEDNAFRIPLNAEEELFLEGSFFYQVKNGKVERFNPEILDKQLKDIFSENGIQAFIETVEGIYSGIHIDKVNKKIVVFSDKLKRQEIYYYEDTREIIISTTLQNLRGKSLGYSPESIISILYLYAPKGCTIYNNIFRLRYNEIIEIAGGKLRKIKYGEEALKIANYNDEHLKLLADMLENAIISRSSDKLNIVQLSGGWDSTYLIAVLRKYYSSNKVKAILAELIASGETYNPYEVEKCRKIARYFDIDLDVVPSDFDSDELVEQWKHELKEKAMNHELYNPILFPQFLMTGYSQQKYGENFALLNGEGCDSLNNFGFAQYHTITHESKGFAEYADKMGVYLYSPSFFKKILDNTYADDFIFKMFKWHFKDDEFIEAEKLSKEDRVFEYLLSFVYSPKRVPFMQFEKTGFIKTERIKEFKDWLKTEYFKEIIANINPDNFYYWLLRTYLDFHWQSPGNIRKVFKSSPNIRLPFLDYSLFKFYAQMPESWGRGLEINNVKYPLKRIIREGGYKYPIDVVGDTGPHSYNRTGKDIFDYYIHYSPISKYLFRNLNPEVKCKGIFSEGYFDVNAMKKYINDVKAGKEDKISSVDFNLLNLVMQFE